jgi:hypothetical protein
LVKKYSYSKAVFRNKVAKFVFPIPEAELLGTEKHHIATQSDHNATGQPIQTSNPAVELRGIL